MLSLLTLFCSSNPFNIPSFSQALGPGTIDAQRNVDCKSFRNEPVFKGRTPRSLFEYGQSVTGNPREAFIFWKKQLQEEDHVHIFRNFWRGDHILVRKTSLKMLGQTAGKLVHCTDVWL